MCDMGTEQRCCRIGRAVLKKDAGASPRPMKWIIRLISSKFGLVVETTVDYIDSLSLRLECTRTM